MDERRPSVSVVIPAYNAAEYLSVCLAHLSRSVVTPLEIIVVDDGSTDETPEIARRAGASLLSTGARRGPAAARNQGAAAAKGDVLFFVDADVCVRPDTVERVGKSFARDPELAAVMGSYDEEPEALDFISQCKNLMHCYVHQTGRPEASTFWSGCGAVRTEVFREHSGFAESYRRPAIEDIELGYRMVRAGRRISLDRGLVVKHLKRWTFWGLITTDVFHRGIPWTELILRDRKMPNDLNLQLSQRVSVALAFLLVLLGAAAAIHWKGYFLTPLFALLFFVLCRYWVDAAASTEDSGSGRVFFTATVIAITWLAWTHELLGLIPPVLLSALIVFLPHRYAFPKTKQRKLTRFLVGVYVVTAILLCVYYLPGDFLVLGACLSVLALVALNNQFYLFLAARRGRLFALAAIPFQLLYYFYCGVAFGVGLLSFLYKRMLAGAPPARATDTPH